MFDTSYSEEIGDPVALLPASTSAATRRPGHVLPTEPAEWVMTDFLRDLPVTVSPDRLIDDVPTKLEAGKVPKAGVNSL